MVIVDKVHESQDGLIRKVDVRSGKSVYTRPITRLCPLDVNVSE